MNKPWLFHKFHMFSDAKSHGERHPSQDAMVITLDPWDDAPIPMAYDHIDIIICTYHRTTT